MLTYLHYAKNVKTSFGAQDIAAIQIAKKIGVKSFHTCRISSEQRVGEPLSTSFGQRRFIKRNKRNAALVASPWLHYATVV